MDARKCSRHFLHHQLSGSSGTAGDACSEWKPSVSQRDFQSAATFVIAVARIALSAVGGDQPFERGSCGGAWDAVSGNHKAEYWRKRCGYRAVRYSGTVGSGFEKWDCDGA